MRARERETVKEPEEDRKQERDREIKPYKNELVLSILRVKVRLSIQTSSDGRAINDSASLWIIIAVHAQYMPIISTTHSPLQGHVMNTRILQWHFQLH